jgi:uncharacterized protein YkuJ
MVGRLPVMKYQGKYWYVDNRLNEVRNINDFSDSISFDDIDSSAIESYDIPWDEVKKYETWR